MKRTQGTIDRCCGNCRSYQTPDVDGNGLCFESRHKSPAALHVRENQACSYWGGVDAAPERPTSLTDRILGALYFNEGIGPRGCEEICYWIERDNGCKVFRPDAARLLEHMHSKGRILLTAGATFEKCETWVARYNRILTPMTKSGASKFEISTDARARLEKAFPKYCEQLRAARLRGCTATTRDVRPEDTAPERTNRAPIGPRPFCWTMRADRPDGECGTPSTPQLHGDYPCLRGACSWYGAP